MKAFVLMEFGVETDDIFENVVKPTLEHEGLGVERADMPGDERNILQDILEGIVRADLVVVDLTGDNPNVYYELGVAHAFQKPTVMLTRDVDGLPFDIRSYRVFEYSTHYLKVAELRCHLADRVKRLRAGDCTFSNPVIDFVYARDEFGVAPPSGAGSTSSTPELPVTDAEPGPLDLALEVEESSGEACRTLERMGDLATRYTNELQQYTVQLEALDKSSAKASDVHNNAKGAALAVVRYAKGLTDEAAILHGGWERLCDASSDLVSAVSMATSEDLDEARELRTAQTGLRDAVKGALASLDENREAVNSWPDLSREIKYAKKKLNSAIDTVQKEFRTIVSFAERMIEMLDTRLESAEDAEDAEPDD